MPAQVGPYRILEVLGRGGMGVVYRAEDAAGFQVALKVIRGEFSGAPEMRRRFVREARASARLRHPNITRILDFGMHEGTYYLVMELLSGGSLADWIATPPSGSTLLRVFDEILSALAFAHARGVVHRDLKPGNVLLTSAKDGTIQARLMDFGVAHFRDDIASELESETSVIGTPAYMSPEQALRAGDVSPESDIYAAGVMLFEMLTGRLPFLGKSPAGTLMAHLKEPIPELKLRRGFTFEGPLSTIMERFLSKSPNDRFRFAADARKALRRCRVIGSPSGYSAPVPAVVEGDETLVTAGRDSDVGISVGVRPGLFGLADVPYQVLRDEDEVLSKFAEEHFRERKGGVVLVSGAMGSGKSRLVSHLVQRLDEAGVAHVWRGIYEDESGQPNSGIREALRRGLGTVAQRGVELEERVRQALAHQGVDDDWEVRALTEFLEPAATGEVEAGRSEEADWALLERVISRATYERPVIVLLEDIHLSGGSALRLMDWMLAGNAREHPWLIVATYRSEAALPNTAFGLAIRRFSERRDRERALSIELDRLASGDVLSVVKATVPMPPELARAVSLRAEGNPLYAVEIVRHLVDSGRLESVTDTVEVSELIERLPDALSALVMRRLEIAADTPDAADALDLWESLAFLGMRFTTPLAESLIAHLKTFSREDLDRALTAGVLANVLVELEPGTWRFENRLAREALIQRAETLERAAQHHRETAEVKARWYAEDLGEHAGEIAQHLRASGNLVEALDYYLRAARGARSRSSFDVAVDFFKSAEELARDEAVARFQDQLDAMLGQAEALSNVAAYARATVVLDRAERAIADNGAKKPAELLRIRGDLARHRGDLTDARTHFNRAIHGYARHFDVEGEAWARYGLGRLELDAGNLQPAEMQLRAASDGFKHVDHERGQALALLFLGRTALRCGLHEESFAFAEKAKYAFAQREDRHSAARCVMLQAEIELARHRPKAAEELLDRVREELLSVGDRHTATKAVLQLARAAEARGNDIEARSRYQEAIFSFVDIGDAQSSAVARLYEARLHALSNMWTLAEPAVELATHRDRIEPINAPEFVALLIDLGRQAVLGGREPLGRHLLTIAINKLAHVAEESLLYDSVDEVTYLLDELDSGT